MRVRSVPMPTDRHTRALRKLAAHTLSPFDMRGEALRFVYACKRTTNDNLVASGRKDSWSRRSPSR